jgi:pimeloyl-ACP methyl ester carboxylesterase
VDYEVRHARSDDVSIAWATVGRGEHDVVFVPGFASNVLDTLGSTGYDLFSSRVERAARFARVIVFDMRGPGLSDQTAEIPGIEARMDDVRAVKDAAGCERAHVIGASEGGPMAIVFAATYP